MKCKKCNCPFFKIDIIPCCDDCRENGAWIAGEGYSGEYTTDEILIFKEALERTQVENEGECSMGSAYGAGCYIFTCTSCGTRSYLPIANC